MADANWDVRGRTVLITGAARGIGAEAARQLSREGANVALVGLEPEELEKVAAECGENAAAFEADVTDREALERAVEATRERFGGIDVVVANAGMAAGGGPMWAIDPELFERTIEVNLLGAWKTVHVCIPDIIERRGYVLVVASVAAITQMPGMGAYCASKAGVEAMCNSFRLELAERGVDVGVAYFGWIDTDLVRGGEESPTFRKMRERMRRGPLSKTYPVSDAGRAITLGIQKRCRVIVAPPAVRAMIALRSLIQRLGERQARPHIGELLQGFEQEIREGGGEASMSRSPGTVAAVEAGRKREAEISH